MLFTCEDIEDKIFKKLEIEIVAVEFLFETDFTERIIEFDEIVTDFSEKRQIENGIIFFRGGKIFFEMNVQNPMERVLDLPVIPRNFCKLFSRNINIEYVILSLNTLFAVDFPRVFYHSYTF